MKKAFDRCGGARPQWGGGNYAADDGGHAGCVTLPMVSIIRQFKSYLVRTCGLRFQRGFWDTRLRDDAHYVEKFRYVCKNPVRRGLCVSAVDWPHVIAFDRATGAERVHRGHTGTFTAQGELRGDMP